MRHCLQGLLQAFAALLTLQALQDLDVSPEGGQRRTKLVRERSQKIILELVGALGPLACLAFALH